MRRYHWVRLYSLLLMIILFSTALFVGLRSAFFVFAEYARQRSVIRSVEGIGSASDTIIREVSKIAKAAGEEQYEQLRALVQVEDDSRLSENDLDGYFRLGYANKIKSALGEDGAKLCGSLQTFIDDENLSNVTIQYSPDTCISEDTDKNGNITALWIKDVNISYTDAKFGTRNDTLSYNIVFPDATFHAGSDELFRYCMVARKGIYMTGRTSSVIGDVYAGVHKPEESREAEIVYGETGTYGGLNILSTQLGVKSDMIISEGDININGSFVMMSPQDEKLECFAQRINEIEGFSKDAKYTLDGVFYSIHKIDEPMLNRFHDAGNLVDVSCTDLDKIEIYYDSDNDGGYTGKYRKIISNSDIEIKNDLTGIIATPGNVIIHKDVNIEGLVLCGDRIYTMGNNNIVANASVPRAIIASEGKDYYGIRVKDFIGGMREEGLDLPDHFVVPYR